MGVMAKMEPGETLASDILKGAGEIAGFLFGDEKKQRSVYGLAGKGVLPVFHIGRMICARRSTLREWIAGQEAAQPRE